MAFVEVLFLAVALAMDCFSVSITCGILQRRMGMQVWAMALLFGLFQAAMPFIGWCFADLCKEELADYDHWIAFILLGILGVKMIREGFQPEEEQHFNPSDMKVLLVLSVGTSIDALSVGFSFTGMGIMDLPDLLMPLAVIGVVSFLMSWVGKFIGVRIGCRLRFPAGQLGGVILIIIGVKVLLTHLMTGC